MRFRRCHALPTSGMIQILDGFICQRSLQLEKIYNPAVAEVNNQKYSSPLQISYSSAHPNNFTANQYSLRMHFTTFTSIVLALGLTGFSFAEPEVHISPLHSAFTSNYFLDQTLFLNSLIKIPL